MNENTAIPVERGCGRRQKGGIYAELGLSPFGGRPVEDFLMDPPVSVEGLDIAAQGVTWIERDGVWHLIDWVGANHYPNITDFVEEIRNFGLSRRLPSNIDFARLTLESRLIAVHARAIIENEAVRRGYRASYDAPFVCLRGIEGHEKGVPETCASMWWEDVEGAEEAEVVGSDCETKEFVRTMPSFSYIPPKIRPEDIEGRVYRPGIFGSFPIGRLVVVNDPDDQDGTEAAKTKAGNSPFDVDLVEE